MVDHKLSWCEQLDRALYKTLQLVARFRRLAGGRTGISSEEGKRLYATKVIPGMLHKAEFFLVPIHQSEGKRHREGSVGVIDRLGRVHRMAATMILGAYKITATDVSLPHAVLLLFTVDVECHCHRAMVQTCSIPPTPLHMLSSSGQSEYRLNAIYLRCIISSMSLILIH